jgi:hypothetical protein
MPKKSKKTKAKATKAATKSNGAARKPGKGGVERARYEMELDCTIDAEIRATKGEELAKVCLERETFLEERRAENAAANDKRKAYDDRIESLSTAVMNGTEKRKVECIDVLLPTNEIQTLRTDTGEVVDSKTATKEDLQEGLFQGKTANAQAKAQREAEEASAAETAGTTSTDAPDGPPVEEDEEEEEEDDAEGVDAEGDAAGA